MHGGGGDIEENPKLDAALQYKNLCKIFLPVASRAADSEDCCLLVENAVYNLSKEVEEKIRGTHIDVEQPSAQAPFSLPEEFANVAGSKKK